MTTIGLSKVCSFSECDKSIHARNYCSIHYRQYMRGEVLRPPKTRPLTCAFTDCDRPHDALGWCDLHYRQFRRTGKLKKTHQTDKRYKSPDGYIICYRPNHPNARKSGAIFEHRLVMSEMLDRPLLPGENVHHKNGVRGDNRPENLELWITSQPYGQRPQDMVEWAEEILSRYKHLVDKEKV